MSAPRRILAAALALLLLTGCSDRFTRTSPDAVDLPRPGGPDTPRPLPTVRVNLAGLPGLGEEQVAALRRAWEAASGGKAEIAVSGTGAADVVVVSSTSIGDAVDARQIDPLMGDAPEVATLPDAARKALIVTGRTYALPLAARLRVLAYDPDRLRRAGIDDRPAPTLESLRSQWAAAAKAVPSGTAASVPAPAPPAGENTSLMEDLALLTAAYGGELVAGDGTLGLTSKPAVDAVELLKALNERGLLASADSPLALTDYTGASQEARRIAPLPPAVAVYDTAKRPFVVTGEVYGLAVSASATDKALAERFIRFVTDPVVARGLLGPRSLAPGFDPADDALLARLTARIAVDGGPLSRAKHRATVARYARAALEGTLPIPEALSKAAAEIEGRPAETKPPADADAAPEAADVPPTAPPPSDP